MNNTNINGKHTNAFACVGYNALGGCYQQNGLSKLEYFTAMAMQGVLSNDNGWTDDDVDTEWVSDTAIKFATKTLEKLENLGRRSVLKLNYFKL
jgi:hypothetical protein